MRRLDVTGDPRKLGVEPGRNIIAGDVLLPRLVVKQSALNHNIDRMAQFCRERGVSLAPHAKTTMAPGIISRQAVAGAWGFTVATTVQAQILRTMGVRRILIANQVVEVPAITWLATEISRDDEFEVLVLVDSVAGVSILNSCLERSRSRRPLGVLIELGEAGGRAGCRTDMDAIAVADAVASSRHLKLVGVECFDALLPEPAVRPLLQRLRGLVARFARDGYFHHTPEVVVSAGSSEYFDIAAEVLTDWTTDRPVRTLLRPGAYATYDAAPGYIPPLEIWSAVASRPEPGLAIAGFGRRDVPSDRTLPIPVTAVSDGQCRAIADGARVTRLMDQHASIELSDANLVVGDVLGCTVVNEFRPAFATWRSAPIVDDHYNIVEVLDVLY